MELQKKINAGVSTPLIILDNLYVEEEKQEGEKQAVWMLYNHGYSTSLALGYMEPIPLFTLYKSHIKDIVSVEVQNSGKGFKVVKTQRYLDITDMIHLVEGGDKKEIRDLFTALNSIVPSETIMGKNDPPQKELEIAMDATTAFLVTQNYGLRFVIDNREGHTRVVGVILMETLDNVTVIKNKQETELEEKMITHLRNDIARYYVSLNK